MANYFNNNQSEFQETLGEIGDFGASILGQTISDQLMSEIGSQAVAEAGAGAAGTSWLSGLKGYGGAGALGSLGYSTVGDWVGLPQGEYSGYGAGGGAMAGLALGGPLGAVLGGLGGGLFGSMFGGDGHEPHLGYTAELGYNPEKQLFRGTGTGSAHFRGDADISDVGTQMGKTVSGKMGGYANKFNEQLGIPTVDIERFRGPGQFHRHETYHGTHGGSWFEGEMSELDKAMQNYKQKVQSNLKSAGLYTNIGPLATTINASNNPYFGQFETMEDPFGEDVEERAKKLAMRQVYNTIGA